MEKINLKGIALIAVIGFMQSYLSFAGKEIISEGHPSNGFYTGKNIDRVAFPIGGIGAGMFCMEGTGAISHLSVNNKPEMYNEPFAFAAISVKNVPNGAKVIEAQVPSWKLFGSGGTGNGSSGRNYGLPRFENGNFMARFPFASLELTDKDIPLQVEVLGWSPFIPTDEDNSSLPAGAMEYRFKNNSNNLVEAIFSWNSRNFIGDRGGRITKARNGFILLSDGKKIDSGTGFSVFVDDNNAIVDHCWFRGGWFDPLTILWKTIQNGETIANQPVDGEAPGASIFVPLS